MKVLLLSAYAAASHVHWERSLQAMFPQWQWQVLSLPPRFFSWRVRGNPLYWALAERPLLELDHDLLIATSMVDLATLRGLVPALARVPSVLYFHENQFDYPQESQRHSLLDVQMISIYSALAADRVLFNSTYNRDSFLAGCSDLLGKLPDRVPQGVARLLREKSTVLPVPLGAADTRSPVEAWPGMAGKRPQRPLRLLWVGRFEHDKGGDRLLNLLRELERDGPEYELAIVGQRFRNSPAAFGEIERVFSHRLVQFGYLESAASYGAILRSADIVLSTALHEFQGLAVLEAVASDCLPVVPRRQAYPGIYPPQYCYDSHLLDAPREARAAAALLRRVAQDMDCGEAEPPDVSAFEIRHLAPRYREVLRSLVAEAG